MTNWVVAKFGGSSVKDAEAMLRCANIVDDNDKIKIVVISATQNTTNQLEFIARAAQKGDEGTLATLIAELTHRHSGIAHDLYSSDVVTEQLKILYIELQSIADEILKHRSYTPKLMDQLYSIGERTSSLLVSDLIRLRMPNKKVVLLDARDVIKTSSDFQRAEPQIDLILEKTHELITPHLNDEVIFVTQGFIGQDLMNNTTTLGREGSDYSAALFGEAIEASLVQIWTDVPGIASSDPRVVKNARFISTLSYDEATALASLGAKVLFPTTLLPTKRKNIPVFVGSSVKPELGGTLITKNQDEKFQLKSVSLLKKADYSVISFVGCHLDQAPGLVEKIRSLAGNTIFDFYDLTAVSVSFKIINLEDEVVLLKAHDILAEHF